jgi:hypothetical protein
MLKLLKNTKTKPNIVVTYKLAKSVNVNSRLIK